MENNTVPSRLHPLDFKGIQPPARFTFPFLYTPHPLCLLALKALQAEIEHHPHWQADLSMGKMIGVLIVEGGFLAAFSGTLCGHATQPYFVPPVFDLHDPQGQFRQREAEISKLNEQILRQEQSTALHTVRQQLREAEEKENSTLAAMQTALAQAKQKRDQQRATGNPTTAEMIRESQHGKASLRRAKQHKEEILTPLRKQVQAEEDKITKLKKIRAQKSVELQTWLFEQYSFLNAKRQRRVLRDIFAPQTPPAAAGECCAPKLLQYAYAHSLRPLCMAEFWIGQPPQGQLRLEGQAYAACTSRCRPILNWMLEGLDVDPNPLLENYHQIAQNLRIIYSDDALAVVSKPAGMLSIPGKENLPNVQDEIQHRFPWARGPIIVHRLDMSTSGLMVVALSPEAHSALQKQFLSRSLVKRYRARLTSPLPPGIEGSIELPMCPDIEDRPRQMVSTQYGKYALTHYRTLGHHDIHLWPHTGRTHQLRVHMAHPNGLNNPIQGDTLYGRGGKRLCLHADHLEFTHPINARPMIFDDETIDFPPPYKAI